MHSFAIIMGLKRNIIASEKLFEQSRAPKITKRHLAHRA